MIADAVAHRSAFNLIHDRTVIKVDCIVRKATPYRRVELARRRPVTIAGRVVQVVAPEDLLLSKLAWARPSRSEVQLRDVRSLIACVPDLDWPYLERWAGGGARRGCAARRGAPVTDTSAKMADLQRRRVLERSGEERLQIAYAMFDTARALMRAGLGDATETDRSPALLVRLFERTYGRDFDPESAARIVAHLERVARKD